MSKGVLGNDPFARGAAANPATAAGPAKAAPVKPAAAKTGKVKAPRAARPPKQKAAPTAAPLPTRSGTNHSKRAIAAMVEPAPTPAAHSPPTTPPRLAKPTPTPTPTRPPHPPPLTPPKPPRRTFTEPVSFTLTTPPGGHATPPAPASKPAPAPTRKPVHLRLDTSALVTAPPHRPLRPRVDSDPQVTAPMPDPQATAPTRSRPASTRPTPPAPRAEPVAHAGSPSPPADPGPHADAPDLVAVIGELTTAHPGSPNLVADVRGTPLAHSLSPEAVGHRVDATTPGALSGPGQAIRSARAIGAGLARPMLEAAGGLAKAAAAAIGLGAPGAVDSWGKDEALTSRLHPLSDFLYDTYWRVTVEGADQLPHGPCLVIANHSGALPLDGPVLSLAMRRERADLPEARWLLEDQVFHAPGLGVLMNRLGAVRAHPDNARRLLDEGRPVIVFPEGFLGVSKPFSERYQLKRFGRGGFIKLAVRHGVPVIPAAIVGAEESMPLLARLPGGPFGLPYLPLTPPPLPARWHLQFGAPIDLSDATEAGADDLAWVQRANDRTRDAIAGMLEAMLRTRTGVF